MEQEGNSVLGVCVRQAMVQRNERQHVERASCKMSVKTDEGRGKSAREKLSLRINEGRKATHFVVDGCQWLATGQTLEEATGRRHSCCAPMRRNLTDAATLPNV